jgi:hypothetical protein
VDVYSFGIVLNEIWSRSPPYAEISMKVSDNNNIFNNNNNSNNNSNTPQSGNFGNTVSNHEKIAKNRKNDQSSFPASSITSENKLSSFSSNNSLNNNNNNTKNAIAQNANSFCSSKRTSVSPKPIPSFTSSSDTNSRIVSLSPSTCSLPEIPHYKNRVSSSDSMSLKQQVDFEKFPQMRFVNIHRMKIGPETAAKFAALFQLINFFFFFFLIYFWYKLYFL